MARTVWCGCVRTGSELKKLFDIIYECVECKNIFVVSRGLNDDDDIVVLCTDHKYPTEMKFLVFTNEIDTERPHHSIYMCPACKKTVLLGEEEEYFNKNKGE